MSLPVLLDWEHPSLYEAISTLIAAGELTSITTLPDAERDEDGKLSFGIGPDDEPLYWIAGGADGVAMHHFPDADSSAVEPLLAHIEAVANFGQYTDQETLYTAIMQAGQPTTYLDHLVPATVQLIAAQSAESRDRYVTFLRHLVEHAPDRRPIKFAISMLALFGTSADLDPLLIIGRCEEFTVYVADAISTLAEKPEPLLWSLAQDIHGWGRIDLVHRLKFTDDPHIKRWLLLDAARNDIDPAYLAYTCAVAGGLKSALQAEPLVDGLLPAARMLIRAMFVGGPAEDIRQYADASDVILLILKLQHKKTHPNFADFDGAYSIRTELISNRWETHYVGTGGWTEERRQKAIALANQFMARPHWHRDTEQAVANVNTMRDFYALGTAPIELDIDVWPAFWRAVKHNPHEWSAWASMGKWMSTEIIDEVLAFALETLSLEQYATGAQDNDPSGVDITFHTTLAHNMLFAIMMWLVDFPGYGWPIVVLVLRTPQSGVREQAVTMLEKWDSAMWTDAMISTLITAAEREPNPDLRHRLTALVKPWI